MHFDHPNQGTICNCIFEIYHKPKIASWCERGIKTRSHLWFFTLFCALAIPLREILQLGATPIFSQNNRKRPKKSHVWTGLYSEVSGFCLITWAPNSRSWATMSVKPWLAATHRMGAWFRYSVRTLGLAPESSTRRLTCQSNNTC